MRVLVLTTDTTESRLCLRPTVTGRIAATLNRGNVSFAFVHPTRLLQELALGSHVALLVVDASSIQEWLHEVFAELRRRVLGPSRPAVVVVGGTLASHDVPRLFASGVSNWLSASQAPRLLDYWHWVCCQSNADLGGYDASRRLSVLEEQCSGRRGYFEMADRRVRARLTVSDGRVSFPEVAEFDSEFTRAVRQLMAARLGSGRAGSRPDAAPRRVLIRAGHWDQVLVRDALEQQLQNLLRWFVGTVAHTRFVEANVWVPHELLWSAEELVDDGPLSRYRLAKGFLSHHQALVANDTALADVS